MKVEESVEYISIAEAATLLRVHRNTNRNRIESGGYKAHKVVTPQGETSAIERESLDILAHTPTNEAPQPLSRPLHHHPTNPSQPNSFVSPDQQAQADAFVQRLLAPFIAELSTVREELGPVKAERDQAQQERDQLRAEVEELRRQASPAPHTQRQAIRTCRHHRASWARWWPLAASAAGGRGG